MKAVLNYFEGGEFKNDPNFSKFYFFIDFFAFLHIFKKEEKFAHLQHIKNFWLHIFKSVGSRKLPNIRKSMQIRMPNLQRKKFKKFLSIFVGKMSLPQTVYFSISNFWYKLTQPIPQWFSWRRRNFLHSYIKKITPASIIYTKM